MTGSDDLQLLKPGALRETEEERQKRMAREKYKREYLAALRLEGIAMRRSCFAFRPAAFS
jgi:hypothetical protein